MGKLESMYWEHEKAHEATVQRVKEGILNDLEIERIAKIFSLVSEPIRLKIVLALMRGEMCVFHLLEVCETTKSNMSHQLRLLKDNGIVRAKRFGKNVEYSITDAHIKEIVENAVAHLQCKI